MENKSISELEPFLLIIDGSSLLSTQFYGNLPKEIMFAKTIEEKELFFPKIMQTSHGVYTNAVYGFLRVMLKIIKDQKPTYLAVTWDVSRNTFRRELYADYKGNRGDTLLPLKEQFQLCQDVLKEMNIPQFMDERYEADDFSGSLCTKFEHTLPVRILTKDNDYLQLVSEHTRLWLIHSTAKKTEELYQKYKIDFKEVNIPERTFEFTKELVKKEFGIWPASVPSLKGLMGDSSDNIKGVPGVGETTAVALIKEYGTIAELYHKINDLNDKEKKELEAYWKTIGIKRSPMNHLLKKSDTLLVGEEAAVLSETLATIKRDIDLSNVLLDSLTIQINIEKSKRMFELLEFRSLNIEKFIMSKENSPDKEVEGFVRVDEKDDPFEAEEFQSIEFDENPFQTKEWKETGNEITWQASDHLMSSHNDILTCNIREHRVTGKMELNTFFSSILEQKDENRISFYLRMEDMKHASLSLTYRDKEGILHSIYAVAGSTADEKKQMILADEITKEDFLYLLNQWIMHGVSLCTIGLKKQLPYLTANSNSRIDDVGIKAYLCDPTFGRYEAADIAEWILKKNYCIDFDMENPCFESILSFLANDILQDSINQLGMDTLYREIELPLIYTLYDMQERGIRVNKEALREYASKLGERIVVLEKEIYALAGETFNLNSPKQLGVILFEKLTLPFGKKTKTGYSTSVDVLEQLQHEHPIIGKVLEYRQLTKLKSTYADGLDHYIQQDGRIHGLFHQTVAATGRISSTDPNLQNIPIRLELGRQIRKVFIPKDGYVFLDADYSQIELRVLAHMSEDERLIEAYKKNTDIHRLTASEVFHTPLLEVTSTQRSNAKAVNFGIVYGISAFRLGNDLNISRQDAEDYMKRYFLTYPRVKEFLEEQVQIGRETGRVTTMLGRIRPVPELKSSNFVKRSAQERIAMNSPIQGTAADIIKIAMLRVNEKLRERHMESQLLLQIHDELLVEAKITEIDEVKEIMVNEMQNAVKIKVPLIAEVTQGINWYEAK